MVAPAWTHETADAHVALFKAEVLAVCARYGLFFTVDNCDDLLITADRKHDALADADHDLMHPRKITARALARGHKTERDE